MILLMIILFLSDNICAQDAYIHCLGIEGRAGYIFPTSSFLRGENDMRKIMRSACSAHLKYSFRLPPGTAADRVYGSSYQGIGLGYFDFGNHREMGTPVALYAFQGARITGITPRLSLNYEWGFGASFGWKPYDYLSNPNNTVMGSKVNAYLSAGIHLSWILSPQFDLNIGATAVHFSNGNTRYPNTGLNTIDFKIGVAYNFNRDIDKTLQPLQQIPVPAFPRHVSYDLMLFGSWRRKAVDVPGGQVPAPGKYGVAGSVSLRCITSDINSVQEYPWTVSMMPAPTFIQRITLPSSTMPARKRHSALPRFANNSLWVSRHAENG